MITKLKSIYISCYIFESKKAIWTHLLVLFGSLFLFLTLYNPFNLIKQSGYGIYDTILASFTVSFIFSLVAAVVLHLFRAKINVNEFMVHDYIFMVLLNLFVATMIFSIGSSTISEYFETFISIGAIVLIPYLLTTSISFILYLVNELIDKRNKLLKAEAGFIPIKKEMIEFIDEYGKTSFYLDKDSILYIEANDNYINIYFYANFRVSYKILRASMRSIEHILLTHSIVRCHRSYMVNVNKINSTQKEKGKLKLTLVEGDFIVPVSNSFAPNIRELIGISPLNNYK